MSNTKDLIINSEKERRPNGQKAVLVGNPTFYASASDIAKDKNSIALRIKTIIEVDDEPGYYTEGIEEVRDVDILKIKRMKIHTLHTFYILIRN